MPETSNWIKRDRVAPLRLKRTCGDVFYHSQLASYLLAFTINEKRERFKRCMECIKSGDTVMLNQGIKELAQTIQKDPRLVQLLTPEDVYTFIGNLEFHETIGDLEDKPIQYHAAAILAKVASVAHFGQESRDALRPLVRLLSDQNKNFGVQIQTLSALTRIAYTFPEYCEDIVRYGALSHLTAIVTKWKLEDDDTILHCSMFLGAVCMGHSDLSTDERYVALSMAKAILRCHIMPEACVALAKLSNGRYVPLKPKDYKILIMYLSDFPPSTIASALDVVGNIARWGSNSQIQCMIKNGVMQPLQRLLFHDHKILRREACWIISNIIVLNNKQDVVDANLIDDLCICLNNYELDVTVEAMGALLNLIYCNCNDINIRLLETGCFEMLRRQECISSEARQIFLEILTKGGPWEPYRFDQVLRKAIRELAEFTCAPFLNKHNVELLVRITLWQQLEEAKERDTFLYEHWG